MLFSKEDLRKLLVPLMLEQLLAVTIGMMDTMMYNDTTGKWENQPPQSGSREESAAND